jgi:hypothetical protein
VPVQATRVPAVAVVVTQAGHLASGIAHFSLPVFILASILTRGLRFFMVAGLLRWYGAPIPDFIEARLTLVTTGFAVLIALGFLSIRYL